MFLNELMDVLHDAEAGKVEVGPELAGEAAGAIEILQTKLNYYEKLKESGRLIIRRPVEGQKCGTCDHFQREGHTAHGICGARNDRRCKDQPLLVKQTRLCCLKYQEKQRRTT